MVSTLLEQPTSLSPIQAITDRVELSDGSRTSLHVTQYLRTAICPRVVVFEEPTHLGDWCQVNDIPEAMTGGFYSIPHQRLLGDVWVNGEQASSIPFLSPWAAVRACLAIDREGEVAVNGRDALPLQPTDLLQAGPLLVKDGVAVFDTLTDAEGFTAGAIQFDSDITQGRHPRTAFGYDATYFWSVVCDGRSAYDAGMTMDELAATFVDLGASAAINLDGGASSVQVSGGKIRNNPRTTVASLPSGRPIFSAIVFEPRQPNTLQ